MGSPQNLHGFVSTPSSESPSAPEPARAMAAPAPAFRGEHVPHPPLASQQAEWYVDWHLGQLWTSTARLIWPPQEGHVRPARTLLARMISGRAPPDGAAGALA